MALKLIKKGVSIGKNQNFIRNNIRDIQCIFDILISVHRELKKKRVHEVCVYAERFVSISKKWNRSGFKKGDLADTGIIEEIEEVVKKYDIAILDRKISQIRN